MSIQLSGVAHRYGRGAAILQDVNLEIGPGETVAIVGPSGSGKTTLISILGGLLRATEGDRRLDGRIATANVTVDMAWIFQGINLIAHRTALDNVRIGLLRSGMDAPMIDAAARRALDRVGLAQRADYRARALSGGEAQRVGVARALAGTPRFVFADEPTGHLDQATSREVMTHLLDERDTGTAVITATHDPSLAARCERRIAIVNGRLTDV